MLQNGQSRDDERNFPPRQFFDQLIAMRVLPVQHRKILPVPARPVASFNFSRHPARFMLRVH